MTISTEITRIQGAKADIRQAIIDKGVSVSTDLTIDDYAACINAIYTGPAVCKVNVAAVGGGGGGNGGGAGANGGGASNYGGGGGGGGHKSGYTTGGAGLQGVVEICYIPGIACCGIRCATGGNYCYTSGGYCVHRFTSAGTFCIVC